MLFGWWLEQNYADSQIKQGPIELERQDWQIVLERGPTSDNNTLYSQYEAERPNEIFDQLLTEKTTDF